MAQKKISELAAVATLTNDDVVCVVDDPGGTPITKKITVANLKTALLGTDHNQDGTHKEAVYFVGDIKETIRSTAPTGWLLCTGPTAGKTIGDDTSGADYAATIYQDLFTLIQTEGWATPTGTWAAHGKIALPDFRDLIRVGASGTKALASAGGAATIDLSHFHTTATMALSEAQMPVHTHIQNAHNHGGQTIPQNVPIFAQIGASGSSRNTYWAEGNLQLGIYWDTATNQNAGSGAVHGHGDTGTTGSSTQSNLQPYKTTNVIIKY
jgi:microcystin-dependent protein